MLYARLLTNAKKATVSVLYWYTSFPSSSNSEFLKTQGSSSSEEETSFYVFLHYVIIAGQSAGAFFRLRTGNPVSVNISRKFFFRGEKIFLPI